MRAFTRLWGNELQILLHNKDIHLDMETEVLDGHTWWIIHTVLPPEGMICTQGHTPDEAVQYFCDIMITLYEYYAEPIERHQCLDSFWELRQWWLDNFRLIELDVPEGFEDCDDLEMWQRWEIWEQKYDPEYWDYQREWNL
jgi:hypothetical protein